MNTRSIIMTIRYFILTFILLLGSIPVRSQPDNSKGKFIVAQDGSGDFTTIQQAVNAVRDHMQYRFIIIVKPGTYKEKLVIPAWKKNIVISNADYSGKPFPSKDFTGNEKYSTYTSYTVLVQGNDCALENLTIVNGSGAVGQAVALTVEATRFAARNCSVLGNQDTLYLSKDGLNYFESCLIAGTTDFIFGEATAVFSKCTIKSLSNSYITAASTTREQQFGFVFLDCDLVAAPGVEKVYLGRPWRPYAKTVFINCNLGGHIKSEGWHAWPGDPMFADKDKSAFYAEHNNSGPGANTINRVAWSKILSAKQAKKYTSRNIFGPWKPVFQY